MMSCKDVSRLVSDSLDKDLPWYRRLFLRLHLFICGACARYEQQMKFIKYNVARKVADDNKLENEPKEKLSSDAKERMKKALLAAKNDDPS